MWTLGRLDPRDLVLVVDDLELANRSQPHAVCDEVRAALARHLAGLGRSAPALQRLAQAVRTRLSFHLVVPMVESWFFAAPTALTALGLGSVPFHKRPGDPESFESTDRNYIEAQPTACTAWCSYGRSKNDRPKWIGAGDKRVWHPKGYIQWLMIDPSHKTCTRYREGPGGAAPVLAVVDWASLLGDPATMLYARALVADLADGLGQCPAVAPWQGNTAGLTSRSQPPGGPPLVLRNL